MSSIFNNPKWFNNQPDILSSINIDIMKDVFNVTHYLLDGLRDRTFTIPDILIVNKGFSLYVMDFLIQLTTLLRAFLFVVKWVILHMLTFY
mgnify:CR=1 FL=1